MNGVQELPSRRGSCCNCRRSDPVARCRRDHGRGECRRAVSAAKKPQRRLRGWHVPAMPRHIPPFRYAPVGGWRQGSERRQLAREKRGRLRCGVPPVALSRPSRARKRYRSFSQSLVAADRSRSYTRTSDKAQAQSLSRLRRRHVI